MFPVSKKLFFPTLYEKLVRIINLDSRANRVPGIKEVVFPNLCKEMDPDDQSGFEREPCSRYQKGLFPQLLYKKWIQILNPDSKENHVPGIKEVVFPTLYYKMDQDGQPGITGQETCVPGIVIKLFLKNGSG